MARPADMVLETDKINAKAVYFDDAKGFGEWDGRLKGGACKGCGMCLEAICCPKTASDRACRWCVGVFIGMILLMMLLLKADLLTIHCDDFGRGDDPTG